MANLINEQIIEERVKKCIKQIYEEVPSLFLRNNGRGLCEKCLVFRFAFYLQKKFPKYFVDCDFNSEYWSYLDNSGNIISGENTRKSIMNEDGTMARMPDLKVMEAGYVVHSYYHKKGIHLRKAF